MHSHLSRKVRLCVVFVHGESANALVCGCPLNSAQSHTALCARIVCFKDPPLFSTQDSAFKAQVLGFSGSWSPESIPKRPLLGLSSAAFEFVTSPWMRRRTRVFSLDGVKFARFLSRKCVGVVYQQFGSYGLTLLRDPKLTWFAPPLTFLFSCPCLTALQTFVTRVFPRVPALRSNPL